MADAITPQGGGWNLRKQHEHERRVTLGVDGGAPLAGVTNVFVPGDLPPAVGGVRTLRTNWTYRFKAPVDITPDVFAGHDVSLTGDTTEQTLLTTSSASPLISSDGDGYLNLQGLICSNDAGPMFKVDLGTGPRSIFEAHAVHFEGLGGGSVGDIDSADCVAISSSRFLDCVDGLRLNGSIKEFSLTDSILVSTNGAPAFTGVRATASAVLNVVTFDATRFTTVESLQAAMCLEPAATHAQSVRIQGCTFRGPGVFLDPLSRQVSDPAVFSFGNIGLADSVFTAFAGYNGNMEATVIGAIDVPVRVGNDAPTHELFDGNVVLSRFELNGAEAQLQEFKYIGLEPRAFHITINCELDKQAAPAELVELSLRRNNVLIPGSMTETELLNRAHPGFTEAVVTLTSGDTLQVMIANKTSMAAITVTAAKWSVRRLL